MKLTCIRYHRDLAAYVDRELAPDRAARLERHVRSCESCSAEVKELTQLSRIAPPPEITPSADFDRIFWARRAEERQKQAPPMPGSVFFSIRSFFTTPAGLSLSAGLAMAVFLVSLYLLRPGSPGNMLKQQELMASAELELYANLDVIQNSEALEHFELIEMLDKLQQDGQG